MRIDKEVLQKVNNQKNDEIAKFISVNRVPIPDIEYQEIKFNLESKNAIVYSVFWHTEYLKLMFYSLLSSIIHTDILNYNIYVLCDDRFYDTCIGLLKGFIPEDHLIKCSIYQKYYMFHLPEIQALDNVAMVDADGFFIGSEPRNIYEILFAQNMPLLGMDWGTWDGIFTNRIGEEKYKKLSHILDYDLLKEKQEGRPWGFNCLSVHPIKDINLKYIDPVYWENDMYCDETVLINNYFKQGLDYGYTNKYVDWITRTRNLFSNFMWHAHMGARKETSFLHPITGTDMPFRLGNEITDMFHLINQKYKQHING